MGSLFLFAQLGLLASTALAQSCYNPMGIEVTSEEVVPCAIDPVNSICCFSNRTWGPGMPRIDGRNTADECLPNGICQNRYTYNGIPEVKYWVEYCTDREVESGNCMDICASTRSGEGTSMITPCDGKNTSTTWCCGDSTACCNDDANTDRVTLPAKFVGMINNTIAGSTPTPTPRPTPSRAPSSNVEPSSTTKANSTLEPSSTPSAEAQTGSSGLSTGAKAGIGIGAAVGAVALTAVGLLARKAMVWRKAAQLSRQRELAAPSYAQEYPDKYQHAGFAPTELASPPPAELAAAGPAELGDYRHSKTPPVKK